MGTGQSVLFLVTCAVVPYIPHWRASSSPVIDDPFPVAIQQPHGLTQFQPFPSWKPFLLLLQILTTPCNDYSDFRCDALFLMRFHRIFYLRRIIYFVLFISCRLMRIGPMKCLMSLPDWPAPCTQQTALSKCESLIQALVSRVRIIYYLLGLSKIAYFITKNHYKFISICWKQTWNLSLPIWVFQGMWGVQ